MPVMTLDELAARTGEDIQTLRLLIQRDAILDTWEHRSDLVERYFAQLFPDGDKPSITLDDALARTGIDRDLALRVREAAGLEGESDLLNEQDVESLRAIVVALNAG